MNNYIKIKKIFNKLEKNIVLMSGFFSLIFLLKSLTQYTLYPITQFSAEKMYISIWGHRAVLVVYLIIMAFVGVNLLCKHIKNKENVILLMLSIITTTPVGIYMFFSYNGEFQADAIDFYVYINAAYISGYAMWKYDIYNQLTRRIESISIVMMPAILWYAILIGTGTNPYHGGVYLGEVNYQHIAITVLPIILSLSINCIKYSEYKVFGCIGGKYANLFRGALIIILWYFVIIAGGTRSVIFGYLLFIILTVGFIFYIKENRKKVIALTLIILILFALQMIFPIVSNSTARTLNFVNNLSEGSIETTYNVRTFTDEDFGILINSSESEVDEELKNSIGSRNIMFELAFRESIENFPGGLGIKGYEHKYETYPHNMVMEFVADFGIIIGGIFLLGTLILIIKIVSIAKTNKDIGYVLLFILGYIIYVMSSGSLYETIPVAFALGLGIPLVMEEEKKKRLEKLGIHKDTVER